MRVRFGVAFAVTALIGFVSGSAMANTIYSVDMQSGSTTAQGTITTDSTVGTLSNANILDWHIVLNDDSQTFTLNGAANSLASISGSAVTATATGLFFDFSAGGFSAFYFQNPFLGSGVNFLCFDGGSGICIAPSTVAIKVNSGTAFSIGSGNQQIATAATTPLPPSAVLLVSALAGLGFAGWRRGRSSAAA